MDDEQDEEHDDKTANVVVENPVTEVVENFSGSHYTKSHVNDAKEIEKITIIADDVVDPTMEFVEDTNVFLDDEDSLNTVAEKEHCEISRMLNNNNVLEELINLIEEEIHCRDIQLDNAKIVEDKEAKDVNEVYVEDMDEYVDRFQTEAKASLVDGDATMEVAYNIVYAKIYSH